MSEDHFNVLMVCTANQCRSPLAEFLLKHELKKIGLDQAWSVSSAGTDGRDGLGMHPSASRVLTRRGIKTNDWRSRRLTAEVIHRADLILTATTAHRRAVVVTEPRSISRTHPLLQFAALCDLVEQGGGSGVDGGRELLNSALAARSQVAVRKAADDELQDPIGRPFEAFELCASTIAESLGRILRPLPRAWGDCTRSP